MDDVKIRGDVGSDEGSCRFTVDRPVYPGGSAYFGSRKLAKHSPLVQRLFEIGEVQSVLIAEDQVTVTKSGDEPWPVFGKQIGAGIRAHIQSGQPAVSDEYRRRLPSDKELRRAVQTVLTDEINPAVAMHGGFIELIEVKNSTVYVRLGGCCQGCGSAAATLRLGVEKTLRQLLPHVGAVLDTTDHAAGRNPYYQSSR